MRIDAHQHFWRIERNDYGWLTSASGPIYRDFLPHDLAPLLEACGIDRTILVQAAPTVAETLFLLEIARATTYVAGVVGWVDFARPNVADHIEALAADPLLVGLRPMVQDIADDHWLTRPDLAPAFRAMVDHGLVFDALVLPRHLSRLLVVLDRHPDLTVVVDHAAKPEIRHSRLDPWRADMANVAARPNTTCKLSGLVTEAAADWSEATLKPAVDHILDVFGGSRMIWGSDWPVVTLAASYAHWLETAARLAAQLGDAERAALFGGNAARTYLATRGRR